MRRGHLSTRRPPPWEIGYIVVELLHALVTATMAASNETSARYAPPRMRIRRWRYLAFHTPQRWVLDFLQEIEEHRRSRRENAVSDFPPGWLLPLRPQIPRVRRSEPVGAIRHYLLDCPDDMTLFASWLLGRCASQTKHFNLMDFAIDGSLPVKRHAARALRRVQAWTQLAALAASAPRDQRLAWYAYTTPTKHPFPKRLANFTEHVDQSHAAEAVGPSRMALRFADIEWIRHPPKSIELIRRILQRIHTWVHGAA